jgi:hypothetical protein
LSKILADQPLPCLQRKNHQQASKLAGPTALAFTAAHGLFTSPVEPFEISLLERTTRKAVTTEGQTFEAFRLALYLYSLLPTLRESLTTLPLDPAFCNRSIFVAQTRLAICESTTPDFPIATASLSASLVAPALARFR